MNGIISTLHEKGLLTTKVIDQKEIYHLASPLRTEIHEDVVQILKDRYLPNEELGGFLFAKPVDTGTERVLYIDKVLYVRNAIEDVPDGIHTKRNAYLPDMKEFIAGLKSILNDGYLPIDFHTHPSYRGINALSLEHEYIKTETSKQDRNESKDTLQIEGKSLLMPRVLIVGNSLLGNDIFIGLYNGLVAPVEFETTKESARHSSFKKVSEDIKEIELSDKEKFWLIITGIALLFLIIRFPKISIPVLVTLCSMGMIYTSKQDNESVPDFFTVLSQGKANINVPKKDEI